uniref:Uncharacterized protein n=1 Tax=Sphenodon punctatus TaxID=8508 RepID=A0A8D0H3G9_SPHPU
GCPSASPLLPRLLASGGLREAGAEARAVGPLPGTIGGPPPSCTALPAALAYRPPLTGPRSVAARAPAVPVRAPLGLVQAAGVLVLRPLRVARPRPEALPAATAPHAPRQSATAPLSATALLLANHAASHRSLSPRRSRRLPSPPGGNWSHRGPDRGDSSSNRRRRSPSLRSESSLEQSLQITVGNDRYCIDTQERRRMHDRLGSPLDNLSDMDRDDMADGPIFDRGLSPSRSLERYPSHEEHPSSPYVMMHDQDYRDRDEFVHQPDYS